MIDIDQAQDDFFMALMSAPLLRTVNVVNERKFTVDTTIELDAIWQTVRNGGSGNGILVEEPYSDDRSLGAKAPIFEITFPIVCFQNGDAALVPVNAAGIGGSGFRVLKLAHTVIDVFYQLNLVGTAGLIALGSRCYEAARDYPGINASRVFLKAKLAASQPFDRAATVTAAIDAGECTLACSTAGARMVYTLDGSFPSDPAVAIDPLSVTQVTPGGAVINPNAILYTGPFAVQNGQFIRAAAYANGLNISMIQKFAVHT